MSSWPGKQGHTGPCLPLHPHPYFPHRQQNLGVHLPLEFNLGLSTSGSLLSSHFPSPTPKFLVQSLSECSCFFFPHKATSTTFAKFLSFPSHELTQHIKPIHCLGSFCAGCCDKIMPHKLFLVCGTFLR